MTYRLVDAQVRFRNTDVVLSYVTSGDQPTRDALTFSTTFVGLKGQHIRQLGFKLVDNRLSAAFSFDHSSVVQYNYTTAPQRTGDRWTIVFPIDALGDERNGNWHADLDVAGVGQGTVPSPTESHSSQGVTPPRY